MAQPTPSRSNDAAPPVAEMAVRVVWTSTTRDGAATQAVRTASVPLLPIASSRPFVIPAPVGSAGGGAPIANANQTPAPVGVAGIGAPGAANEEPLAPPALAADLARVAAAGLAPGEYALPTLVHAVYGSEDEGDESSSGGEGGSESEGESEDDVGLRRAMLADIQTVVRRVSYEKDGSVWLPPRP